MPDSTDGTRRGARESPIEPAAVDTNKASIARVYDCLLGGRDNYAADRAAADATLKALPDTPRLAHQQRAFLRRAVRYLVGKAGIGQIIDIGSGLPTAGNVHEIAHEIDPRVRVVYVDNDSIVLAHGRALLADEETTTVITADVREPDTIFDHPDTRRFIDQDKPLAVLLGGILHHLEDEENPQGIAMVILDRLPSGSYLLAVNFHDTGEARARELERAFVEGGLGTGRFRTWNEQRRYFEGLDMVAPGLVPVNEWRPDVDTPTESPTYHLLIGGVGQKP